VKRRNFVTLLGGAAAVWPLAARAQQPAMPVIGFLNGRSPQAYASFLAAFLQGLKQAGYVDGQNALIEYRWAQNQSDRLPGLAAELVRYPVAVMVTSGGDEVVQAARAAAATTPIVSTFGFDPVARGLASSLNRPGGNITGVSVFSTVLVAKRLELLRELVPNVAVVAFLVNPANPSAAADARDFTAAAEKLAQRVVVLNAPTAQECEAAFDASSPLLECSSSRFARFCRLCHRTSSIVRPPVGPAQGRRQAAKPADRPNAQQPSGPALDAMPLHRVAEARPPGGPEDGREQPPRRGREQSDLMRLPVALGCVLEEVTVVAALADAIMLREEVAEPSRGVGDFCSPGVDQPLAKGGCPPGPVDVTARLHRIGEHPYDSKDGGSDEEIGRRGVASIADAPLLLHIGERVINFGGRRPRRVDEAHMSSCQVGALGIERAHAVLDPIRHRPAVGVGERDHFATGSTHTLVACRVRALDPILDQQRDRVAANHSARVVG
jgi:ABC transporter substrate binding protein